MIIQDDRTQEQKDSHYWLIIGTDKFMSGWGKAKHGPSYAAWACDLNRRYQVMEWVNSRSDMLRVREAHAKAYRPKGPGHLHIYVVEDDHPALERR